MFETFLDFFGSAELIGKEAVFKLLMRLAIDLITTTLVVRWIYVRLYSWNEQVFTCFAFNIITFSLCLVLRSVPIELGFALGLFAVFGILRYRTEPIRTRDLTYLFVVIGIAILNAVVHENVSVAEIMLINAVIVGMTYLLELHASGRRLESAAINYDNPNLLLPGNEQALADDLRERTGLTVEGVKVSSVDLIRDTAQITVSYHPE